MTSKRGNGGGGLFSSIKSSGLWNIGKLPMNKSINSHGGVEVTSPEGNTTDAAEEATKGRLKPEEQESLWNIVKKYIGMDIMNLGILPISFLEPRSQLQRVAELAHYSPSVNGVLSFLDQANKCQDPYMQLVYAASWSMSFFYAICRTFKALNPIFGETYEMVNYNGLTYIGEQVSHHPPIDVVHAENEHFTLDSTNILRTKLLGNSLEVYPGTRTRINFKRDGVVLDCTPPRAKLHNLIFGRMWISLCGEISLTNLTTGDYVVLKFQPSGWFSGARFGVDGYVYNAAKEPKILMTGKWTESMSYQPCDEEGKPFPGTKLKEMLASDSRLRPDRYALEKGDISKVNHEKNSLEVRQRKEKKRREANGDKFTPKWFDFTKEVLTTPYGETRIYQYNGKYNEHRATVNSLNIGPDEVDVQPTEFNPWQYEQEEML